MSSERLPVLPIPQPQGSSSSSSSSPRVGSSLGSTSILNNVPSSSFTNGNPSNGLKTPSPSQTPSGLGPAGHSLPVQSPQQSPYSSSQHSSQGYNYDHNSYSTMNQGMGQSQPYMDFHQSHISGGQPQAPQTVTSGGLSHYPAHQQPPLLQPGPGSYSPAQGSFGQYGYANGVSSPQSAGHAVSAPMMGSGAQAQLLPLPGQRLLVPSPSALTHLGSVSAMASNPQQTSGPSGIPSGQGFAPPTFDTTGQVAPPGMKPRVTATLWEDEGSLCFQVEAKGVCVARREDNHMINGTKLLNVAGMTRGRRDGILKSEKMRHVVKIGPMHLKGVWIPFERALDFANKEKITELLYPLFVHNIGALLYHPTNQHRTNAVLQAAAERRRQENQQQHQMRTSQPAQPPSLHHHHSMHNAHLPGPPHSIAPHPQSVRPVLDRAHTFPTPPTSASSIMGMGSQDGAFQWTGQNMVSGQGTQPLAIDTGLSNARSMPTTPATTPPGNSIQNMQQYQGGQAYDNNPRTIYSAPPPSQSQYVPPQNITQQNMARFGQPLQSNHYIKNEMGPPSVRGPGSGADSEHQTDTKGPDGLISHSQGNDQVGHGTGEEEAEHEAEHDAEYTHDNTAAYANRGPYNYAAGPGVGSLQGEHPHLSPEMTGSPSNQAGSGRATPRTTATPQQQWVQQSAGYNTPPRAATAPGAMHQQPPRSMYNVVGGSDQRVEASNGGSGGEGYSSQPGLGMAMQTGYASQQPTMNGSSNKRMREVEEDDEHGSRPSSRGAGADGRELKRSKTIREGSAPDAGGAMGSSAFDRDTVGRLSRTRPAISQRRR